MVYLFTFYFFFFQFHYSEKVEIALPFGSDASGEERVTVVSADGSSMGDPMEKAPPVPPRKSTSTSPSHSPASLRREVIIVGIL